MGTIFGVYIDYMRAGHAASGKPVFLVSNRQGTGSDPAVIDVTREGFPILDGLRSFLVGARCLMQWRDFLEREPPSTPPVTDRAAGWRERLGSGDTLDEYESSLLLADFGLPANPCRRASQLDQALEVAGELGYPVVLKSLQPGLLHKTDRGGVILGLDSPDTLAEAYSEMSARLGPDVLVSKMIEKAGTELVLGMIRDEQFGPLVLLGFGGINVQSLQDVSYALAPFDAAEARRLTDRLRLRALMDARRNRPAGDIDAWCRAAAAFSRMVHSLADVLKEVDINPVILTDEGCVAVDALVVGRDPATETTE
jgi:acyl-CoA synthetase (NDP forming)